MAEQKATNITWHEGSVSREERQQLLNQKGVTVWMTGLSAAGKSTIACIVESRQQFEPKPDVRGHFVAVASKYVAFLEQRGEDDGGGNV